MEVFFNPTPELDDRITVSARLSRELPGKNLYDLAAQYGVTVRKNGRLNKGWAGQTVEHVAQVHGGNLARRDGIDFELKSTSLAFQKGGWVPKETIRITQVNPKLMLEESFETSTLWNKLQRIIIVGLHHPTPTRCEVVRVNTFDVEDPELVDAIRSFWQEVRMTLSLGEIAHFLSEGTSDDYLQLRPSGTKENSSRCPITGELFQAKAFYGTKRLVRRLLALA